MLKRKRKKVRQFILYLIFILLVFSCDKTDKIIFDQVNKKSNNVNCNFKREKGYLVVDDYFKFKAYSFNTSKNKKLYGYWGIIRDTLFFVNPIYNDDNCIVKFPILFLNDDFKKANTAPVSNCYDIPIFSSNDYKVELLTFDNEVYKLKHTILEPHMLNNDYCIFELSLHEGIINFEYFRYDDGYQIPWCYENSSFWESL